MEKLERILVKLFGKERYVTAYLFNPTIEGEYEEILYVERDGIYALMSPQLKDKKVLVVYREDWLLGESYEG